MYKIFVVFNYETIIKGYYNTPEEAKTAYEQWKFKYGRQGYTEDVTETETNEEWVYTVTRIPFYGSSVDPGTGFRDEYPTGMTDTIEIHLELGAKPYAINPFGIPFPSRYGKQEEHAPSVPHYHVSAASLHGTVTGTGDYPEGSTCTLTYTPNTGYRFTSWSDGDVNNPRTFVVNSDVNISVVETETTYYTLTATAINGVVSATVGGAPVQLPYSAPVGTSIGLSCTPNTGFTFTQWSDGVTYNPRQVVLNNDVSLSTVCTASSLITISAGGLNCTITATANGQSVQLPYECTPGTQIVLTCTPNSGFSFQRWTSNLGLITNPVWSFTANSSVTATAVVNAIQYSISCTPSSFFSFTGTGRYNAGSTVTLTAIPNAHCHFTQWSDGVTTASRTVIVDSDKNFAAEGGWDQYTLSLTAAPIQGLPSGNVYGAGTYNWNTSVQVQFTELNGLTKFASWSDGGEKYHTVTMTENLTLIATATPELQSVSISAVNGTISREGGNNYGDTITAQFVGHDHYHFDHWSDSCATSTNIFQVDGPINKTAYGVPDTYSITGTCTYGVVQGSVDGETWVSLPQQVPYGTQYWVKCVPTQFHKFLNWSDSSTDNPRSFTVTGDASFTAVASDELYPNAVLVTPSTDDEYYIYYHDTVSPIAQFEYSVDGEYWRTVDFTTPQTVLSGKVKLRGNNSTIYGLCDSCIMIERVDESSGLLVTLSGKVTSLLDDGLGEVTDLSLLQPGTLANAFSSAYSNKSAIGAVVGNFFNFTAMSEACCRQMFLNCKRLTTVTATLPLTTLTKSCYHGMFSGCSSLTTIPDLPATTARDNCYESMFSFCSALTTPPTLGLQNAAKECCSGMFAHCTSLTESPRIILGNLTYSGCCAAMFSGCTNLNKIYCRATAITLANNPTKNWALNVAASGTFYALSSTSWPDGDSGIPYHWTRAVYPSEESEE